VRQLTKSANLDRAITLASTVRTDCRRVLGEEHPLSQAVAANLPRARATTAGRRVDPGGESEPSSKRLRRTDRDPPLKK